MKKKTKKKANHVIKCPPIRKIMRSALYRVEDSFRSPGVSSLSYRTFGFRISWLVKAVSTKDDVSHGRIPIAYFIP